MRYQRLRVHFPRGLGRAVAVLLSVITAGALYDSLVGGGLATARGAAQACTPLRGPVDNTADKVIVLCWGAPRVTATIGGETRVVSPKPDSVIYEVDPCTFSKGRDLPGATVRFEAAGQAPLDVRLGDDTLAPEINVVSVPDRGTIVQPGKEIELTVTAWEKKGCGPWQTGVERIQVRGEPDEGFKGGKSKDWVSLRGRACKEKSGGEESKAQRTKFIYKVPENPPPVIKLCAWAEDFAGNPSQPMCGEFFTGDVKPCPKDKPLGGWTSQWYTQQRLVAGKAIKGCMTTVQSLIRFSLVPTMSESFRPWPSPLHTGYKATDVHYKVSTAGCKDVPGDDYLCQAAGGTKEGTVNLGKLGERFFEENRQVFGRIHFYPTKPELEFVGVEAMRGAVRTQYDCKDRRGPPPPPLHRDTNHMSYGFVLTAIWPKSRGCKGSPWSLCTAPTVCEAPKDEATRRDCVARPDRYAVIPFSGSFLWEGLETDPTHRGGGPTTYWVRTGVRWEVCCGCAAGPPPGTP